MASEEHNKIPRRHAVFLLLVWAATVIPFLLQPFHIDDRIYLEIAENARQKPFFPYDYAPVFEGLVTPDAASHSHLPLTSYYLALVQWATGSRSEWIYHLAFSVFPLLLAFGGYDLARRYVRYPLAAASLLLLSPGVFVLSHTLMTEVPLLAFWVFSVSRFLRLVDRGFRFSDWLQAALGLLAASFISLLATGLVMLLAAYWLLRRLESADEVSGTNPGSRKWIFLLLALPFLLWGAWYLRAYLHYDRLVLVRTLLHLDQRQAFSWLPLATKLMSFVINLGGAFLFPLAIWYGFSRKKTGIIALVAGVLAGLYATLRLEAWRPAESWLMAVLFGSGVLVLLGLVREFASRFRGGRSKGTTEESASPRILLFLWFFGILLSAVLLYPSGSVRYTLLAAPPILLAWLVSLQRLVDNSYFRRNLVWLGVFLTALQSFALGITDYRLASMYRDVAAQIVEDYGGEGRRVWFTAEWGLRYYLEKSGARIVLRTGTEPEEGDIIAKPFVASPWVTLYDSSEYLRLLEQREAHLPSPLRMLDFGSHAGFYSTAWGMLPFSFAREERWEWINVFEVVKKYEGPIPEPERHY